MAKNFQTAKKPANSTPSNDAIAAFEQGGVGKDNVVSHKPTNVGSKKAVETTKRLSLDLPASEHTRFKTACSATGRKMVSEIQFFIQQRTLELEEEAGITHK